VKYSVVTFGCRVNQADSLAVEEALLSRGLQPASPEQADVVIVNTCSVTAAADQGARQTIRRIARTNPAARIVVTGCYASREPQAVATLPNVLRVVRNEEKSDLAHHVEAAVSTAERFADGDGACGAHLEPGVAGRTAFTLRVQTGCGEPCSYCIIPATRGEPRSVAIDAVLHDVTRAVGAGFKEIALTGVHLGSYGRDLAPQASLIELLTAIASRYRRSATLFRVSSLEPMDCTPGIVRAIAEHDCFAPHFHLPLQHASNAVLAAMRRPYTIEQYSSLVDDIRSRLPHAAIGSDVIVGFPGETDEHFDALASYLEGSPLTHVHVFPYSDRPGTAASTMSGRPHGSVVRERAARIRAISAGLAARFRTSQHGVEHRALTLEDGSLAVTANYLKLRIPPGRRRNEWIRVRVADDHTADVLTD
jgi:threonylcarbamoyladenosine tRNA methylthiotransferase MtaB